MRRAQPTLQAFARPLPVPSIDLRRAMAFVDGPLRLITLIVVLLMFIRIFLN